MALFNVTVGLGLMVLANSHGRWCRTPARSRPGPTRRARREDLVGRYVIVSGEQDGAKEPEERIKGTVVTFTKDSVVVADKDKKELYSATYKLDSDEEPQRHHHDQPGRGARPARSPGA